MTTYADVNAEYGGAFVELRPRVQFGPAARCQVGGCKLPASLMLMPNANDLLTGGPGRQTCADHLEESLELMGLAPEGTVIVRRLI